MTMELVLQWAQIISTIATVISVLYLAVQIKSNKTMTKLKFGFSLNNRLYQRYFESAHNAEFARFLSRNWREEEFEPYEYWRMTLWIQTCLVDLFDSYEQYKCGVVGVEHLNMRMHLIKSGIMLTKVGRPTWEFWKKERSEEFIAWFEKEVFGKALTSHDIKTDEFDKLNMVKKTTGK